ncbi:hypothetical protein GJ629_13255, partial [Halapricum sp. CBA1109]|uniref:sensor histidine kinase n=1 Tax=Halapricum sp. CBA1109 TaxID=2668068 RepID=UPI0013BB9649
GPGIPEAVAETLFEQGELGPESSGTGIGLYIVSTLVERYDGSVHVEDGIDGGAAFVVSLRLAESAPSAAAATRFSTTDFRPRAIHRAVWRRHW